MHNFELQFWHIGGCGGYPLSSKSILKVKKQMPLPKEHGHVPFLTKMAVLVGNLGLQSMSKHYEKPCIKSCLLAGCRSMMSYYYTVGYTIYKKVFLIIYEDKYSILIELHSNNHITKML